MVHSSAFMSLSGSTKAPLKCFILRDPLTARGQGQGFASGGQPRQVSSGCAFEADLSPQRVTVNPVKCCQSSTCVLLANRFFGSTPLRGKPTRHMSYEKFVTEFFLAVECFSEKCLCHPLIKNTISATPGFYAGAHPPQKKKKQMHWLLPITSLCPSLVVGSHCLG